MSKVYVIADLHLGHRKLAEVRGFSSTDDHDNAIVEAWNKVVTKRDVVYVLGDVFKIDRIPDMLGTKKLALGNHDQLPASKYLGLFSKVQAYYEFDNCLLSHIPVHPGQMNTRYKLNVHGHTHSHVIDDPRYVSVSVERCPDMSPRLLSSVIRDAIALRGMRVGRLSP